jgi:hypothetical protein
LFRILDSTWLAKGIKLKLARDRCDFNNIQIGSNTKDTEFMFDVVKCNTINCSVCTDGYNELKDKSRTEGDNSITISNLKLSEFQNYSNPNCKNSTV